MLDLIQKHSSLECKFHQMSFLLATFLLVVSFSANAAEVKEDTQDEQVMELDLGELLDIQINTGSFLDLNLKDVPAHLTIISDQDIYNSGAMILSDVLEIYVPSFQYMFNRWNGDIWTIRGVSADFNNKILFLVNGIKMNLQGRNGAATEMNLGLWGDIQRIEVLEGPAGMVYGSGAIAGIVNIVTKSGSKSSEGKVGVTGSNTGYGIEGTAHAVFDSSKSLTVSVGYRKNEGNGDGKTKLWGYQDWPENAKYSGDWPSKGSYGETPGNIRASIDLEVENFSLYARATRQQWSTASMFARYPWDWHAQSFMEIWDSLPSDYDTTGMGLDSLSIEVLVANHNDSATAHNAKYFPDVEIEGELFKYDPNIYNGDSAYAMAVAKQANQTRRFSIENLAFELGYKLPVGDSKEIGIKLGAIAAQNRSYWENQNMNTELNWIHDQNLGWGTYGNWGDLLWSTFGERRYYGQLTFKHEYSNIYQGVHGVEYRYDDIGDDFFGENRELGSESHFVVRPVQYHNFSAFSENFISPIELIDIHAGLRFDKHTRTDGIINPKIATVLKPSNSHIVKAVWQMSSNNGDANAYEYNGNHVSADGTLPTESTVKPKNPASSEYTTTDTSAIVVIPSADDLQSLKPEKSISFELISVHDFLDKLIHLSPSISYNMMRDNFIWNGQVMRNVNIGDYNALVLSLSANIRHKIFNIGLTHSFQRPIDTDPNQTATSPITDYTWVNQGNGEYLMIVDTTGKTRDIEQALLKEAITYDGDHFLNVATNVTKFVADVTPVKWFTFNTNARIFWGFPGRKEVNKAIFSDGDAAAQANADYLAFDGSEGIRKSVAVKWNMGTHFKAPKDLTLSFFLLNVLGDRDNVHAIRWQNMTSNLKQRKMYTTDTRAIEFRVEKKF